MDRLDIEYKKREGSRITLRSLAGTMDGAFVPEREYTLSFFVCIEISQVYGLQMYLTY